MECNSHICYMSVYLDCWRGSSVGFPVADNHQTVSTIQLPSFLRSVSAWFYVISVDTTFRSNIIGVVQVRVCFCVSAFVLSGGNFWARWRRLVAPRGSGYYWQVAGMPCHQRQIRPSLATGGRTPPVAPRPLAERHQRRASREELVRGELEWDWGGRGAGAAAEREVMMGWQTAERDFYLRFQICSSLPPTTHLT